MRPVVRKGEWHDYEVKDVCYIGVSESTFPVENRLIYALNTAQLNRARPATTE